MKTTMKFLSLMLALLLICSTLVACGKPTTFEVVTDAVNKTLALDSISATMEMTMDMEMASLGTSVEVPMTTTIKASGLQSDAPVILTELTMSMMGIEMETVNYVEGEYMYMTMLGESYKVKMEDMTDYDGMNDIDNLIKALPEALLSEIEATENADGTKTVKVEVPNDMLDTIYGELLAQVQQSAAEGATVDSCNITEAAVEITIDKDGYISVYDMSFLMEMGMSVEGFSMDVSADVEAKVTYENPGEPVTVTPPEGYQDFPEANADEIGL
ncbi:MAG: hypothetical protein IJW40_00890 [Clostridia bacterium]|nr:hypothetical protein [Clostridia bacterium]